MKRWTVIVMCAVMAGCAGTASRDGRQAPGLKSRDSLVALPRLPESGGVKVESRVRPLPAPGVFETWQKPVLRLPPSEANAPQTEAPPSDDNLARILGAGMEFAPEREAMSGVKDLPKWEGSAQ